MANELKPFSPTLFAAGLFGLTGVALGAMGAHALKATLLERGMAQAWETAARYHLFHALALLGLAAWLRKPTGESDGDRAGAERFPCLAWCWCIGTLLFSGSLYGIALGGPSWLGPVTPVGGVLLLVGWLLLIIQAFGKRR